LSAAFGKTVSHCTGGQHRSVYCAQHLAEYLAKRYNITIKLYHREQGIEQEF
ncbi:MAG: RNase adapter RapZ, partial [Bacteroidia bacterium]|nr:RNase adapter RapZ [Bacteroidia bacterium]